MSKYLLIIIAMQFAIITTSNSQPVISFTPVISSGLTSPVDIVSAGDGTNRIFIAEQGGTIKVYSNNYTLLNSNFLTITGNISTGGERGLLSVAFHPDYKNNRYFFVYYTNSAGGINIDRFQTLSVNPNQADAASRTNIMTIVKPVAFANHNGGKLNFGADGNLYFGLGDGGDAGDPRNYAQRGDSLWGKMIRINVNNFTTPPYYTIPADNPFITSTTVLHEIFALGLRNPWRWSFDRLNGNTWIADVGQGAREEIDVLNPGQARGANYGWRCYEGMLPYNTTACLPAVNYTTPIFDYPHNAATGGFAVTGGYVYRGALHPAMYGYYICADYISGNAWLINAITHTVTQQPGTPALGITGFGELENGEITAISLSGALYSVSTSAVLAVHLLQWNGNPYDNYNQLNWQTADEKNVQQFEVEYSKDGIAFATAGTITAKNEIHAAYTFRHMIQNNLVYYRLKTVDLNGSYSYSEVISLKNNSFKKASVIYTYNGNAKMIWLNIPSNEKAGFKLFDLNGINIVSIDHYQNNAIVDLQKIPTGIYIGKIILANQIISEKVFVQ